MREGQQTENGEIRAESTNKVVRLPRDWLGPREELVPFGNSATPSVEDPDVALSAPDVALSASLAAEAPPSPNDFWGERSASVHDALQAPADGRAEEAAAGQHAVTPEPSIRTQRPTTRLGSHKIRVGTAALRIQATPRRRLIVSLATAIGVGLGAALAVAALSGGSTPRSKVDAKLNVAAILSSGVSKISNARPPRIVPADRTPRPRLRPVRHVVHRPPKRAAEPRRHETSPPPAPTYTVQEAQARSSQATSSYHSSVSSAGPHVDTSTRSAHPSTSSGATASSTGEAGALGPVSSPNG